MKKHMGITLRTALLSWLITIVTLLTFVTVIIPEQKRAFLENLYSKALGISVSLRDVAAGSVVNADFSSVVDHCMQMLQGDASLKYIVITRSDGFSLIHDRDGWRQNEKLPEIWHPEKRVAKGGIDFVPFFKQRVFHYSQPFDYSGIEWGWIHVGLSLDSYDKSVSTVYWRTGLLSVLFIILSLIISVIYAKKLVKPILNLQSVVHKIAGGNLSARAAIEGGDELASLAGSVNTMTDALLKRDKSLQNIRFSAQRFLSTSDWKGVIDEVLAMIGKSANVNHVYVSENRMDDDKQISCILCNEWNSTKNECRTEPLDSKKHRWYGTGYDRWASILKRGELFMAQIQKLDMVEQELLNLHGIKSLIIAPIIVDESWWGILGLDDCLEERVWTDAEQDSLRAIADMLGAAIGKQRTQEALLQAKEAAEAASVAKSQFLANMSHEIRTPMNGVLGMVDLLLHTNMTEKQLGFAQTIRSSGEALLNIIDDVLDLSKIEAGKLKLEEVGFDPIRTMEDVVELMTNRAQQKAIKLTAVASSTVQRMILGDPGRLRQILLNMISNAVKFTEFGEVSARLFQIKESDSSVTLRFEVQDTGMGIPGDVQKAIFDPFIQADGSTTRKFGGTGLGLAITRQLVEMMGGQIGVISDIGKGSTFWFTIQAKKVIQQSKPASTGNMNQRKILIIGSSHTRLRLQQMLSIRGIVSDASENAWQAIILMQNATSMGSTYDVIILDMVAGGTDSIELIQTLISESTHKDIKVILITQPETKTDTDLRSFGIDTVLTEPVRPKQLFDSLDQLWNPQSREIPVPAFEHTSGKIDYHARVLVAEDNLINQQVVASMLDILGCESDLVANGYEVLNALTEKSYDLILMDCLMPEMDGYETTRSIRLQESESTTIPRKIIIALTASAMEGDRQRCLEVGMDDYLRKPFNVEQLSSILGQWLPKDSISPSISAIRQIKSQTLKQPGEPPSRYRASVLVVEDNTVNQQIVISMLELLDCKTEVANNGLAALKALSDHHVDLVLMDGQMPEMDGYEATRIFRKQEIEWNTGERTAIIAMTAHASVQDRRRCLEAGMDDYLSKPFKIDQLLLILDQWLPAKPQRNFGEKNRSATGADSPKSFCTSEAISHKTCSSARKPMDHDDHTADTKLAEQLDCFNGNVLVAEDDPVIQELVTAMLNRFGCDVTIAATGLQALENISTQRYDLIFMDYNLPEMNGCEITRAIREMETSDTSRGHTPIIAVTGQICGDFWEQCRAAGMDDHLGKPFYLAGIHKILKHWLPQNFQSENVNQSESMETNESTTEEHGSCLNGEAIERLRILQRPGSTDLIRNLIHTYLAETPSQIERLEKAVQNQDAQMACNAAHSLKSSSAFMGAHRLSAMCTEIEATTREKHIEPLKKMLSEIAKEFEKVQNALLKEI
jgi:CheY-like chemotaxis protein/signal transduction histidine kinase/HPt (histidine-containing phosphotransfer) domain-containing protein/HAMP domain-containing protein